MKFTRGVVYLKKKKLYNLLFQVFLGLFLLVIIIFTLYPVLYSILGSLKTNMELTMGGRIFPKKLMFSNYVYAFQKAKFTQYTINSIVLSGLATVFALITSSLAGFCMARYNFPGKKILMSLYLSLMFISLGAVSLYPQYRLMHDLGLTSNLLGLALVLTGGQSSNVFLIMGFVKSVPRELDESAYLDGCGTFRIYWNIILPLIRPILGVVALFSFRAAWNDYITSMVFTLSKPALKTLTVAVVGLRYSANAAAEWHIMAAGAAIAIIPILIIYVFTNKQFISGLTAGAVKG